MDQPRSALVNSEENIGIPDDLRCKRSDGKQWRCTAMSMSDKTVCEKHYIQAKRRAANSALRASMRKAKRKLSGEGDIYLESKSDDGDMPLVNMKNEDYPASVSSKRVKERGSKSLIHSSPERPMMNLYARNSQLDDDSPEDIDIGNNWRAYGTPVTATDASRSRSNRGFDASAMSVSSDRMTDSSEDTGRQTCHQCCRNDRDKVIWCQKCDRRSFCENCISLWYPDIPSEELEKSCPACRGICNCKVCLRADNLIKVRIREIPAINKLEYLYCVLSSVLPVVNQIHNEQLCEVELEKKTCGTDIDLARVKLSADEQMCCNVCRIPIIDYHRHCPNCSYDLCLRCCQDLRAASTSVLEGDVVEDRADRDSQNKENAPEQVIPSNLRLNLVERYPTWRANTDGSIPCLPEEYGGCNYSSTNLNRIFKMYWVAKLQKNVEEMVKGCKVNDAGAIEKSEAGDFKLCQFSHREDSDNYLYCPSSEDVKCIDKFRQHWGRGEPIIVRQVFKTCSMSSWDPVAIWRGIAQTSDEKMKDENRIVKAISFLDSSEVDVELGEFLKGYSNGCFGENGLPQMLKLKDWPSPSASEEYLLYKRPEFISKLPLMEYIHPRLGLLNVAAKMPHYSLQNDAGPRIYFSYGANEELGRGDSVTNLHFKMCDMVYLLVHTHKWETKGLGGNQTPALESGTDDRVQDLTVGGKEAGDQVKVSMDDGERMDVEDQEIQTTSRIEGFVETEDQRVETTACRADVEKSSDIQLKEDNEDISEETSRGVHWDVFCRQDVPKLVSYLKMRPDDFEKPDHLENDFDTNWLYDGTIFLNSDHKRRLKEEFGVEPWSFEQCFGQAVFVPAGCPFQARNLQCNVQLGLDFLSPESFGEAARLAEEIRCLPNEHEAKLQVLEVGKISLYAASSAIKEVQKLVLDPKLGAEIGFEDPNLTAPVAENIEKLAKRREIRCA